MKRVCNVILCVLFVLSLAACGEEIKDNAQVKVYYVNVDGNALLQETYPSMSIEKILEKMQQLSAMPQQVKIEKYELANSHLRLYFNEAYAKMDKGREVLLRAAIVQTMVQLEEVAFVSFYVNEEPLADSDGNVIGLMRAEDFVQNTGSSINSYQTTELKLYFADKDGKTLKEVHKSKVHYYANTSMEKLVIEQLMKGTNAAGRQSTIPKTTKLLGVSVKDGVCYVNFDSKFSLDSYDLDPQVAIYSIVNSIIGNSNVSQVQILIDGASDVVYKNSVDLSRPLGWNEALIEE